MFPQRNLESLLRIFEFKSKKELTAYCKTLTIHAGDFANLILATDLGAAAPYRHRRFNRQLEPKHLQPTGDDFSKLRDATPGVPSEAVGKFTNKIRQLFIDRRFMVGHLFYTPGYGCWQFFYFDQRDLAEFDNHWAGGAHVHLVNDLWTALTAQSVVDCFKASKPRMPSSLHIRYDNSRE